MHIPIVCIFVKVVLFFNPHREDRWWHPHILKVMESGAEVKVRNIKACVPGAIIIKFSVHTQPPVHILCTFSSNCALERRLAFKLLRYIT